MFPRCCDYYFCASKFSFQRRFTLAVCKCNSLSSFFFQTFEYFRETTQLLEQHGSVNVKNGKVLILQEKDVSFSANMWRPILTAYWVSIMTFLLNNSGFFPELSYVYLCFAMGTHPGLNQKTDTHSAHCTRCCVMAWV